MEEEYLSLESLQDQTLVATMKQLFVILNGEEQIDTVFCCDESEGVAFEVTGNIDTLIEKTHAMGIPLMHIVLDASRPKGATGERDYTILGISSAFPYVEIYRGLIPVTERFLIGYEKDYPEERIYVAIESRPDIDYFYEMLPPIKGEDILEITITDEMEYFARNN